jgi:hypothetical protein
MDGDEGKTFYVIRFLDHFSENCCIELPYQYFISFNSGLAIRSSMDPVRLLYLHDPTRTTIGSDFYTCTIRPDPTRTGDPIRRGLAIRSDYYTCPSRYFLCQNVKMAKNITINTSQTMPVRRLDAGAM